MTLTIWLADVYWFFVILVCYVHICIQDSVQVLQEVDVVDKGGVVHSAVAQVIADIDIKIYLWWRIILMLMKYFEDFEAYVFYFGSFGRFW